ncbi:hypothetical protein XENTR_v10022281 [Xenopus tropicalis]|nr:hypothetical protein XENTR_v10022281 [Xenopus tropicalis]
MASGTSSVTYGYTPGYPVFRLPPSWYSTASPQGDRDRMTKPYKMEPAGNSSMSCDVELQLSTAPWLSTLKKYKGEEDSFSAFLLSCKALSSAPFFVQATNPLRSRLIAHYLLEGDARVWAEWCIAEKASFLEDPCAFLSYLKATFTGDLFPVTSDSFSSIPRYSQLVELNILNIHQPTVPSYYDFYDEELDCEDDYTDFSDYEDWEDVDTDEDEIQTAIKPMSVHLPSVQSVTAPLSALAVRQSDIKPVTIFKSLRPEPQFVSLSIKNQSLAQVPAAKLPVSAPVPAIPLSVPVPAAQLPVSAPMLAISMLPAPGPAAQPSAPAYLSIFLVPALRRLGPLPAFPRIGSLPVLGQSSSEHSSAPVPELQPSAPVPELQPSAPVPAPRKLFAPVPAL